MSLRERLHELMGEHGFSWIEVVSMEGLSICEVGAEELPELAARLPSFLESGDEVAKAAHLGYGMDFMLLIPKKGSYALLMRSFEVQLNPFMIVVGTTRLPSKPNQVLTGICAEIAQFL